jgi:arginyl-tRNA synthetase
MIDLAQEEISKRTDSKISKKLMISNAKKIGLAAIKFFLLRINPDKDIHFNPKESISFIGNTGPYCQYAYARIQSVLLKEKSILLEKQKSPDFSLLTTEEDLFLARYIMQLPEIIKKSANELDPSFLCRGIYNIAKAVHQYYQKNRILDDGIHPNLAVARLKLLKAASISLKAGLKIIGIETINKM